jgi:hypothetical protein
VNIKLISEIGDEPISLDEAKAQLMYTATDQDNYISGLISAARVMAEIYNGRQQTLKQWDLAMDHWPGSPMAGLSATPSPYFNLWPSEAYNLLAGVVPWARAVRVAAPLVAVSSVTYRDDSGVIHTLNQGVDYFADTWKEPGLIAPCPNQSWPSSGLWPSSAIHIQFTAGKISTDDADGAAPWAAGTAYAKGTVVTSNGFWVALQASIGVLPGSDYVSWGLVDPVGRHIKQGMLLLVTQWFEDRIPFDAIRSIAEMPFSVTSLFTSDKLWV